MNNYVNYPPRPVAVDVYNKLSLSHIVMILRTEFTSEETSQSLQSLAEVKFPSLTCVIRLPI